jgi:hypothetical protein
VANVVHEWLEANSGSADAGEAIGAWLRAKGKIEMVWPYVSPWLETYSSHKNAVFLLSELAAREAIPDEAKAIALTWLDAHSGDIEAELVMSAWLRGKHETHSIRRAALNWCATFATELHARYLFERWVTAGGDAEVIRDPAIAWLVIHRGKLEAERVFVALLKSGVHPKEYAEYLKVWTPLHKRTREASFLYCEWLYRPRLLPSAIANSTVAWLDEHAEWVDADFVLNAWLKNDKADTQVVRAGYDRWIARYGSDRRARIVRENWERATERERVLRTKY